MHPLSAELDNQQLVDAIIAVRVTDMAAVKKLFPTKDSAGKVYQLVKHPVLQRLWEQHFPQDYRVSMCRRAPMHVHVAACQALA